MASKVRIWYKREFGRPELVDTCSKQDVCYMLHEYAMAMAVLPGQHRHGKDKVWAGRRCDEPKE